MPLFHIPINKFRPNQLPETDRNFNRLFHRPGLVGGELSSVDAGEVGAWMETSFKLSDLLKFELQRSQGLCPFNCAPLESCWLRIRVQICCRIPRCLTWLYYTTSSDSFRGKSVYCSDQILNSQGVIFLSGDACVELLSCWNGLSRHHWYHMELYILSFKEWCM